MREATTKALDQLATAITISEVSTVEEIYDRFWILIDAALAALARDPIVSNRSFREVESELWALLVHLAENRDKYVAVKQARARVQEFGTALARGTDTYEMAIGIDHLTVPDSTNVRVASCALVHFDSGRADEWGLSGSLVAADIVGHTALITQVHAGSFERAWELAAEEIDTALAVVRTAMASSGVLAPLDELFLQRRGSLWAGRRLTGEPAATGGFRRGFRSVDIDLRDRNRDWAGPLLDAIQQLNERLMPAFNGSLPPALANALSRAAEWIGSSITREHLDDKVVDLCTAMETMLAPEKQGLKGESVALRYLLLIDATGGGNYLYPHAPLPIYEVRSLVIHGARRRAASGQDYMLMREIALNTLGRILELARKSPELQAIKHLVRFLERSPDRIEMLTGMLLTDSFKPDRNLRKFALKRAAELRLGQ